MLERKENNHISIISQAFPFDFFDEETEVKAWDKDREKDCKIRKMRNVSWILVNYEDEGVSLAIAKTKYPEDRFTKERIR